jgi:hypothetical protein
MSRILGVLLLTSLAASAEDGRLDPIALAAPGPVELDQALGELEARLARADHARTALVRMHNQLGEAFARAPVECGDAAVGYAARTPALGRGYRERVQSARAQVSRVDAIVVAPTVATLASGPWATRVDAARERVRSHEATYAEALAWQERWVLPLLEECDPPLTAGDGIGPPTPGGVAVLVRGRGFACPSGRQVDGFAVLDDTVACVDATMRCGCAPARVLPGAVLAVAGEAESALLDVAP